MLEKQKKLSIELKEVCDKCGKSISREKADDSITGWLFKSGSQSLTDRWACSCQGTRQAELEKTQKLMAKSSITIENLKKQAEESNVIGNWRLLALLGQGYLGNVFLAESVQDKKKVALRIFNPVLGENKRIAKRFLQEAEKASSLTHRNIGLVFDQGRLPDGTVYVVSEYLEGITLDDKIAAEGFLDPEDALDVMEQLAEALQEAHENNVLHRAVKPTNVRILANDKVKLVDFGLEKAIPTAGQITQCLSQVIGELGNPLYMSPEQVVGEKLTPASDIYSLGCIIYEALTGKKVFEGYRGLSAAMAQLNVDPEPFSKVMFNADIPKPVEAIVMKCLEKDPDNRYQSGNELLEDLEAVKDGREPAIANAPVKRRESEADDNYYPIKEQLSEMVLYMGIAAMVIFLGYLFGSIGKYFISQQQVQESSSPAIVEREVPVFENLNRWEQANRKKLEEAMRREKEEKFIPPPPPPPEPVDKRSEFTDSQISSALPGTWKYSWDGKKGELAITKVWVDTTGRKFAGVITGSDIPEAVSGRVSVRNDSLFLMNLKGLSVYNSSTLKRDRFKQWEFKKSWKTGFEAVKLGNKIPDKVKEFKLSKELVEGLEGRWNATKSNTMINMAFELKSEGNKGIFTMKSKFGKRGVFTVDESGNVVCEYDFAWQRMKYWKEKDGKYAIGEVEGVPLLKHE